MRNLISAAGFIALALLCWGLFGPTLQAGVGGMLYGNLRPLICLAATFSLIAIAAPMVWMLTGEEDEGGWTTTGVWWAGLAGCVAALGTFAVTMALKYRGNPLYVMPVAFGVMAVVYSLSTAWLREGRFRIGWVFPVGALLTALGAAGVMFFSPTAQDIAIATTEGGQITITRTGLEGSMETKWTAGSEAQLRNDPELAEAFALYQRFRPLDGPGVLLVGMWTLLTGLGWGIFAPMVQRSSKRMEGSRLRPLLVVGITFALAGAVLPVVMLATSGDVGQWTVFGTLWSLAAGVVAAAGILGIVLAYGAGGRPSLTMPIVFGVAPLVSIAASLTIQGTWGFASTLYFIAMGMLVAGVGLLLLLPTLDVEDSDEGEQEDSAGEKKDTEHTTPKESK